MQLIELLKLGEATNVQSCREKSRKAVAYIGSMGTRSS